MIIGSISGWLTLAGSTARPAAISSRTSSGVDALADRHELHLRRDDPGPRVGRAGSARPPCRARRSTARAAAAGRPSGSLPGPGRVVEPHRRIVAAQLDLRERHPDVRPRSLDVHLASHAFLPNRYITDGNGRTIRCRTTAVTSRSGSAGPGRRRAASSGRRAARRSRIPWPGAPPRPRVAGASRTAIADENVQPEPWLFAVATGSPRSTEDRAVVVQHVDRASSLPVTTTARGPAAASIAGRRRPSPRPWTPGVRAGRRPRAGSASGHRGTRSSGSTARSIRTAGCRGGDQHRVHHQVRQPVGPRRRSPRRPPGPRPCRP